MLKMHDIKSFIYKGCEMVQYFSIREKNDINGNPRYRVFIIYGENTIETIYKTYESNLQDCITRTLNNILED